MAMGVMEETHLSYKAASSKCHSAVVGKKLYRHQAPVSTHTEKEKKNLSWLVIFLF